MPIALKLLLAVWMSNLSFDATLFATSPPLLSECVSPYSRKVIHPAYHQSNNRTYDHEDSHADHQQQKRCIPSWNAEAFWLALFILVSVSACAPSLPLYLEVWDATLPATAGTGQAKVLIQPFDASIVAAKPIGELYGWQSSQQIKVDQQALANGLTSKFERQLALQGLTPERGSWDGTLAGLKG